MMEKRGIPAYKLVEPIEAFAPLATQESWDNSGFSVGDPLAPVSKALVALDCTEEVLEEAIGKGCDIIITHHPLIFRGLKQITPQTAVGRIVAKALRNNITIYSAHTNMDKASGGVSALMAQRLSLQSTRPLTAEGFGIIGELPQPLPFEETVRLVKRQFGLQYALTSKPATEQVQRVAVCGGSGKDFIADAAAAGAELYITGDISYHFFYPDNNLTVMDIGHFASEYGIVELFAKIVSENFHNFALLIGKESKNPVFFY